MAYHNLRSKLDRAVVAYLISKGVGSGGTPNDPNNPGDTFPANGIRSKGFPLTVVQSLQGIPDPLCRGNYRIRVSIAVKGATSPFLNDPNDEAARLAHDGRVSAVFDALMQTDDGETLKATAEDITAAGRTLATPIDGSPAAALIAANNVDMLDFTILGWFDAGFGDGNQDSEGADWVETLYFDALCCPSNVD